MMKENRQRRTASISRQAKFSRFRPFSTGEETLQSTDAPASTCTTNEATYLLQGRSTIGIILLLVYEMGPVVPGLTVTNENGQAGRLF